MRVLHSCAISDPVSTKMCALDQELPDIFGQHFEHCTDRWWLPTYMYVACGHFIIKNFTPSGFNTMYFDRNLAVS